MANKGVLVNDQVGGESVACIDARNPDESSNARIIQQVNSTPSPITFQSVIGGTPLRSVTVADGNALGQTALPGAISGNPVDMSDSQTCIIYAKVTMNDAITNGQVVITPIIMSEGASPALVALLPPIQLRPISPQKVAAGLPYNYLYIYGAALSGVAVYPTQVESFPSFGAKNIGFHVYFDGDVGTVDLYAYPGTVVHQTSKLDTDLYNSVWGPNTFPMQESAA